MPVYPHEQASPVTVTVSERCQEQKCHLSFDDLVGAGE